ncbi:MAG: hypothetical protein ABSG91_20010, partial [Syntrophobacteraceae bacterium]
RPMGGVFYTDTLKIQACLTSFRPGVREQLCSGWPKERHPEHFLPDSPAAIIRIRAILIVLWLHS